jgi:small subunit ribosomal protein S8
MGVITDPIADMLTRIRNALMAGHTHVSIPASKMKRRIAEILEQEGYILGFRYNDVGVQGEVEIDLKYIGRRESAITGLKRVSRPGRRVYKRANDLPQIRNGLGIAIISTSQGLFTDREARERNTGGEVLCYIW